MFKKLVALPSEDEIKSFWKYKDKIYISIVCTCFNQERYIKDALESFLAQKTEYAFEIIVHDDASKDTTPSIIARYALEYPQIIRVIQQSKNHYSIKPTLPTLLALNEIKGDYIALCEGDDYWLSEDKLQVQLQAMLSHPKVNLSFHGSFNLFDNNKTSEGVNHGNHIKIVPLNKVILGGGAFMPTASLLFKASLIKKFNNILPSTPVGDFYMQVLGSDQGALYLPSIKSVYRKSSEGSWSSSSKSTTEKVILNILDKHKAGIELLKKNIVHEEHCNLETALAHETYVSSRMALTSRKFELYRKLIEKAHVGSGDFGLGFKLLYCMRKIPSLSLLLFKLFSK